MTGMVSRIVFAWLQGTSLDRNSKAYRLVADVLNDLAIFIELLSPLVPGMFLAMACLGNLMKAIVGVAGGATRSALRMHQVVVIELMLLTRLGKKRKHG